MLDKKYKVLNNYFNKSEFNEEVLDITLRGISKIANTKIANRIKKEGLKKLHLYFNPDYLPFLTFFIKKNLDLCMKKQIYYVGSIDLNFKKFFIDQIKQFRIFYPFLYARKSNISRAQYMFINLNNFKNPEKEIKVSKMKWLKNLDKIENNYSYFRNLPISCYSHGPHRDTWFGHTFNATNLWFSITGVNKKNGLII